MQTPPPHRHLLNETLCRSGDDATGKFQSRKLLPILICVILTILLQYPTLELPSFIDIASDDGDGDNNNNNNNATITKVIVPPPRGGGGGGGGDRKRPPKKIVPDNYSIHDMGEVPNCIYTSNGGYGNNIYGMLWTMTRLRPTTITTTTTTNNGQQQQQLLPLSSFEEEKQFPCIDGFYKYVMSSVLENIEACPETQTAMSKCSRMFPETGWDLVKKEVVGNVSLYKPLYQLNKTFIHDVFSTSCPSLLEYYYNNNNQQQQPYCSVHIRFGDALIRNTTANNRICTSDNNENAGNKDLYSNRTACLEFVAETVRYQGCPNTSLPIFIAVDYLPFVEYFRDISPFGKEYSKILTCSPKDGPIQKIQHAQDMGFSDYAIVDDPNIRQMIADWLGVALATDHRRIFSSTFRETARLGFYVV